MSENDPQTLCVRTELLERLRDIYKKQQHHSERRQLRQAVNGKEIGEKNDGDDGNNDDEADGDIPMAVRFVRFCPPLTDPSWAMEELLRINPNVAVWTGTGLSNAVWALPGSGHCPFGTTEADFWRQQHLKLCERLQMRLVVKCSVGKEAGGTKELVIHNPVATLSNVRAAIAINFRLPVHGFRMVHSTVDLGSEKVLLRDSGIRDGDLITVAAKRDREDENNDHEKQEEERRKNECEKSQFPRTHQLRTNSPATDPATTNMTSDLAVSNIPGESGESIREPVENGESGDDDDDDDDGMEDGPTELLCHLLATVPNLVEMRHQFLANPAEIMQQIQQRDPRLLELITANHQEFLDLVNNEDLVETLQREQDAAQEALLDEEGEFDDDDDEEVEFDEELGASINSAMAQFLAGVDVSEEETNDGPGETQRYLERVPTEEEEAKIEQLMQLGFTRDQCKVAFFKSRRSLERAANLLFEEPPQL